MKIWKTFYLKDNLGVVCFKRWWSREITVYFVEGTEKDIRNKSVSINIVMPSYIAKDRRELRALIKKISLRLIVSHLRR